ncbi:MAG: arginine--tRNA ligase [Caldisericia bacterium]|nr:arginine--tRNA ligase [Caldisericia bacterium]MDD4615010.1 arginine--tRNA ligase [Caldisericia bacterium]
MLIRSKIVQKLHEITTKKGWDIAPENIVVEQPPKIQMGDFATTLPLALVKSLRRKPVDIANEIASEFSMDEVASVQPLPNGYINFFFSTPFLQSCFKSVLENPRGFISNPSGMGKKALVEFVSANPTGPLTVANGRSAPIGDAIANLLEIQGYHCDREFFINDMGAKAQKVAKSVFFYYAQQLHHPIPPPEEMYPGDYVPLLASSYIEKEGDALLHMPPEKAIEVLQEYCISKMISSIREDLEFFQIYFQSWFKESTLHDGYIQDTFQQLCSQKVVEEKEGAHWFLTTQFGDEKDRVLIRSNGLPTYLLGDIAYHRNKLERGYDLCVDVWGADQSHVNPLKWALEVLGFASDSLKTVTFQLVHLFRDNKEVKMSKSGGNYITLRDLLNEAGPDVSRFVYLSRSNEQHLNFDLDVAKNRDPKSPVFYAQYAFTRCKGIGREAEACQIDIPHRWDDVDISLLTNPSEIQVLRRFAIMPELLDRACSSLAPHLVTQDIHILANDFHSFYENCRVIDTTNIELTKARLLLVKGIEQLLSVLFAIIGIQTPERM